MCIRDSTPNNVDTAPGTPQHKLLDLKRDSGRFKTRFPVTGHGSVTWIDTASGPTLHYTKEPWCLPDAAERYRELMSELKIRVRYRLQVQEQVSGSLLISKPQRPRENCTHGAALFLSI